MTEKEFISKHDDGNFVYSDSDSFRDIPESIYEALDQALSNIKFGDPKVGVIYRGREKTFSFEDISINDIIEKLQDYADENLSEECCEFFKEIEKSKKDELEGFLVKWSNENIFTRKIKIVEEIEEIQFSID